MVSWQRELFRRIRANETIQRSKSMISATYLGCPLTEGGEFAGHAGRAGETDGAADKRLFYFSLVDNSVLVPTDT
jgi:hypothetical protein